MPTTQIRHQVAPTRTDRLLTAVLKEVKSLRQEFSLPIPHEELGEYAHPRRIKNSYEKALREFSVEE